jgi:hypothetical protein
MRNLTSVSRHNLFDHFTGDASSVDDYYENLRRQDKATTVPQRELKRGRSDGHPMP